MTHQVIVGRDPGDETTHDPEGAAEQVFGGGEGAYHDVQGNEGTIDEVLS